MTQMRNWLLVGVACGAIAAGGTARAQAALDSQRGLDGHVFQPSFLVRSPLATTSFNVNLAYGVGDATGPTYNIRGEIDGERQYSFAQMGQTFAYERQLAQGVSVGGGLLTSLYSGTDSASALVIGADVSIGGFARATAGRRLGPVQTALTLDVIYGPRLGIVVIDAIKDSLANGVGSGSALALQDVLTLQPGVAAAWAPHPALGVTASLGWQWVSLDKEDGTSDGSALAFGIAADLDLKPLTRNVPLGLLAAYHFLEPLQGEDVTRIQDFSIGAFYTAKPELVLGAEIGWRWFSIRPDIDASSAILDVRANYYW
jgi:hypothetical protein